MHFSLKQKDAQNSSENFWEKVKIFLTYTRYFILVILFCKKSFMLKLFKWLKLKKNYIELVSHGESVTYIDGSRAVGCVSLSYNTKLSK